MEDFDDDVEYIIRRTNLTALMGQTKYVDNPSSPNPGSRSRESRIASYFSMLTGDTKKRLYELFKVDFEMFGYDGRKYLR